MKGILFKPDMIQAIVEGRKTQTRRVIQPQPVEMTNLDDDADMVLVWRKVNLTPGALASHARYQVGEVVYIKEKALYWDGGAAGRSAVVYVDDPEIPELLEDNNRLLMARETTNILAKESVVGKWAWKSPLFMFAEDARYFIKITDVREARLQEITGEDAIAEGCTIMAGVTSGGSMGLVSAQYAYKELWNSINAKWKRVYNTELKIYEFWQFPWCEADSTPIPKSTKHPERYHCIPNPWVWVYQFKAKP